MREAGEPGKGVEAADPAVAAEARVGSLLVVATHRIRLTYCVP